MIIMNERTRPTGLVMCASCSESHNMRVIIPRRCARVSGSVTAPAVQR